MLIVEMLRDVWKVGQQPSPRPTKEIWDFVIFELRNKSWKVGQKASPPPTDKGNLGFCHF